MNSILIYCEKSGPRLKYILHLLIEEFLGLGFSLTHDLNDYQNCQNAKINYSRNKHPDDFIFIPSCGLVQESGIKEKSLQVGNWHHEPTLFNSAPEETIPFDLFSASFYLVSRYEEYLPHVRDQFERFEAESSIAFQHQFLEKAIVNRWVNFLGEIITRIYPHLHINKPKFQFISTIDVDNAFAFKQKGIMRSLGGYVRGLVNLNRKNIVDRTKTIFGKMQDPFDTYEFQLDLQRKYN